MHSIDYIYIAYITVLVWYLSSWMTGTIFIKFSQLILMKIIKIIASICQILRAKIHQIIFRLGLHPRPNWGKL